MYEFEGLHIKLLTLWSSNSEDHANPTNSKVLETKNTPFQHGRFNFKLDRFSLFACEYGYRIPDYQYRDARCAFSPLRKPPRPQWHPRFIHRVNLRGSPALNVRQVALPKIVHVQIDLLTLLDGFDRR